MKHLITSILVFSLFIAACKKEEPPQDPVANDPQLSFQLTFDETLPRLGNFGEPAAVPAGHAAQHPRMGKVSLHYIEFASDSLTPLGMGPIVYKGEETDAGGDLAVDFEKVAMGGEGETIVSVDLNQLPAGTYRWIRVSLTYQKYEIDYLLNYPPYINNQKMTGTLASFVGFNTYITHHQVQDSVIVINGNRAQGYWAFETQYNAGAISQGRIFQGDGAGVTVVNPIASSSPIPAGSCVVTGQFKEPLVITGEESEDLKIELAFSINNSFEWEEVNEDGEFEPGAGESVTDMGLRGLHPRRLP